MAYNILNRSYEPWLDLEEFIVEIESKFEDFTALVRQPTTWIIFAFEFKTLPWFCLLELTVLSAR